MAFELISDLNPAMIGVAAISVVMSFLCIYIYGIREKSFEDVIEEQKKRSIQEEMQQKIEKGKKEKKYNKKWSKKTKEKGDQVQEKQKDASEVDETKEELDSEFEIIEPKDVKSKQKGKKAEKVVTIIVPENAKVSEKVQKVAVAIPDKTAQEIKEDQVEAEKKSVAVKKEAETIKAAPTLVQNIATGTEIASVTKKKRKEHAEKVDKTPKLSTSKLLSMIKETELEMEESQTLIDILLNKQKDSATWTPGRKDQLTTIKKNLQEKEQLFEQEWRQHQATTAILKELREEFNQLKSKSNSQDRINQEKIARQQQEIHTLNSRIKQVSEQLKSEKENVVNVKNAVKEDFELALKSSDEEKSKLSQAIAKLEAEMCNSGTSKSELDTLKKSHEELQKVHSLFVDKHTQLITSHKTETNKMNVKLSDLTTQLCDLNGKHAAALKEATALKEAKLALEEKSEQVGQLGTLQGKLQEAQKQSVELQAQIAQLKLQLSELNQQNSQLLNNAQSLQAENERLTDQLTSTKERVAGDGQEIVHQNGEINGKVQEEKQGKSTDEKDKQLQEKESLLVQLNEDLNKQKAKISVLNEEIEIEKQKNNELRQKNWKAMDALTNAEKNTELKIKDIEQSTELKIKNIEQSSNEKLLKVQKEYEKKVTNESDNIQSSKDKTDLEVKLKEIENISAKRLQDYNSELEKNRHLTSEVQRIATLQESSNLRIAEVQKNLENLNSQLAKTELTTKEFLQRILPDQPIDKSLPLEAWLVEFEKQTAVALKSASSSNDRSELLARIAQYEEEKERNASKLFKLEMTLSETSTTLQKMKKDIERENIEWTEKLSQKDLELQKIREERDALSSEKDALQSALQQMGQLEEMEEKLKLLQSTLETAENERSQFEQKYDEVNKNCMNLRDQLELKEQILSDLQKDKSSTQRLEKQLEDLKLQLEKEKKISKDFASNMMRLNSLVKIGQDALTSEQEVVKNLKSQLEAANKAVGNGTSSAPIQSTPITVNEDASGKK